MKLRRHLASIGMVALAVVGLGVVVMDRGGISDRERAERDHDVFPAYRRGDIDRFELTHGDVTLRVERRPDPGDAGDTYWQMTAPVDERADPAAVDRFIGDLEFAGAIRKVDPRAVPGVNDGFVHPEVTGTLSMKPLVYHFALGGPAPAPDGAAYFRVDGEGTYVVSKDFATSLRNGAGTYRERSLVPYLSLDLAGLEIDRGATSLALTRADDISFKITGSGLRASRDGMDRIWGSLAEAHAESFLSDVDADRALDASAIRVRMVPKDTKKPPGEIEIGGVCPGHADDVVLVRKAPTRKSACVPKGAVPGLLTTEASLVDRRLFAARADEVEEITFERVPAGLVVEIARKGHGWHERKPLDRELAGTEVDAMNDLVTRLTRGEALEVRASNGSTAFEPRARVRVRRGGSGVEEVVELGVGTRVRRSFDGADLTVPDPLARALWPSEIALRGRVVFPDALGGKYVTGLETDCDGVRQSLVHEGDRWAFQRPSGFHPDTLATVDLVALLRNAQAESWVAERDDGTFGLANGHCRAEVHAVGDGGSASLGLIFGRETDEGTVYATTNTDPTVFLAPHALRDGVATWLIDRQVFDVGPSVVEQVTLSRGATHAVFKGHAGENDGGARDPAAKVLSALEVLRADAVIHLGPPLPSEGLANPTLDVRVKRASRDGGGGAADLHFVLGETTLMNRERVVYARVEGVDATYGIARERVNALIDAF